MKGTGLLLTLSSFSMLFCIGLKPSANFTHAEEVASTMPANWSYQAFDEEGNAIENPLMSASAYNDAKLGNSLKMTKMVSAYTLTCSSDYFAAAKDNSYKLTFLYRSDCLDDDENRISASIKERKSDNSLATAEVAYSKGRIGNWTEFSGYYTTSTTCESLMVSFSSTGMGEFFISDVSLVGKPAPTTFYNDYGTEAAEDAGNSQGFKMLSSSFLSDDAHSGERSIKLTNQGFRTNFNELPTGEYELRFKYKHDFEAGNRVSIRMDSTPFAYDLTNATDFPKGRSFYAEEISDAGTGGGWATYSYKFRKIDEYNNGVRDSLFCSINYIKIFAYGTYLFDDLEIVGSDNFNYIIGGSFEGYDVNGLSFNGTSGIVKNTDGTLVLAGSQDGMFSKDMPSVTISNEKLHLTPGNTYTLKYQYRGGWGSEVASAYYGDTKIYTGSISDNGWTDASASFVAEEGKNIKIIFCNNSSRFAYVQGISVLDSENNECMDATIKEYSSTDGDNINSFPYGEFDYEFPSNPDDSSIPSSSEDETFSRETRESEEEDESSKWSETNSNESIDGSDNQSHPSNQNNGSSSALTGVTIGLLVVATIGLAVAIFALVRGKKHDK